MDNRYHVADLRNQEDALEAIRRLESRLSEQSGAEIALVAYTAAEQKQEEDE